MASLFIVEMCFRKKIEIDLDFDVYFAVESVIELFKEKYGRKRVKHKIDIDVNKLRNVLWTFEMSCKPSEVMIVNEYALLCARVKGFKIGWKWPISERKFQKHVSRLFDHKQETDHKSVK